MSRTEAVAADGRPPPADGPPWSWRLTRAAEAVAAGSVVAYPTEGVYGLGCDPFAGAAVARLCRLKRRSPAKGLILIAERAEDLEPLVAWPDAAVRARVTAPGGDPVTWVVPARPGVPGWLTGCRGTIAVRLTHHPVARALCARTGPLVSTSANPAGAVPARDPLRVRWYFGRALACVVPGPTGGARGPTRIRDAVTGAVLR